ncbi:hypothetical protein QTP88_019361 [Uroleucon formosanum]
MNKLNNDVFRSFLSKYCNKNIPCESTLRKGYFDKCYEEVLSKIREAVGEHKIWVCIDETTDSERRNVANIIVGILQPESCGNLYLLHTDYLDKVNSSTITQLFDKAMHILWPTNVKYDNILLFISDAAPYMKKAGSTIQTLYPNIIHLTCLAHTCHNVCEEVRAYYKNVDQLISEMKKTFLKCPKRIAVLKEKCPELPNPPRPIITRWGTWINAVKYYCTNFNELKSIIEEFEEESECVRAAKRLFKMPSIQSNLVYIVSNFGFLPDTITKLETRGVLLSKSVDIVNNIQIKLEECNGEIAKLILDKFNKVISKNKGWENIKKINQVLIGETTSDDDLSSSILNLDNYLRGSFNTNVFPSSKKNNVNQRNSFENEIINTLHQSVELRKEQIKNYEEDADRLFWISLLKPLKEIPEHLRFSVKIALMKGINNDQINMHSACLTMSNINFVFSIHL